MMKKIKLQKKQFRSVRAEVEEKDGLYKFSFASEAPYERYWGVEIISMKPGAMRMDRLEAGAPLLFNHKSDSHLGIIEKAWIEGGKAYCEVRFSQSPFAQEKRKDVDDKILVNASFGYEILEMSLVKEEKNAPPEYLVKDFMVYEVSLVTIPADYSVGVGRSAAAGGEEKEIEVRSADEIINENTVQETVLQTERNTKMTELEQRKQERERIAGINLIAEKHGDQVPEIRELAKQFIDEDKTAGDFAMEVCKRLGGKFTPVNDTTLDMTQKEMKSYSISRAIMAVVNNNWSKAGFELECHKALEAQLGRETKGFFMPTNVRAPYLAGTATQGQELVQTTVRGDLFIDALRNKSFLMQAGAVLLSGLTGNIAIPKKNGRSAVYWVAENGTITESEATFEQVSFTPKTIGALSVYTQQLLIQGNPSIDALVQDDLYKEVALGIDYAGLNGSGSSGQPTGLMNKAGINSVAMGANGLALSNLDKLIDMETAVAEFNADVASMAYATNAKVVGALKKLKDAENRPLWDSSRKGFRKEAMGEINGYDIFRTNQVRSDLTKGSSSGVCSALVFGDFSQLVLAQWGAGIEIVANPYGSQFAKGGIEVRAMSLVDVNVRQTKAFSVITDILTA